MSIFNKLMQFFSSDNSVKQDNYPITDSFADNLILEFIDTIGLIDKIQFEEVQKVFYIKILTDIKFLKIYLEFLKIITYIYNKFYEIKISDIYTLEYFFSIIELKFKKNYLNIKLNNKFAFIDNFTDDKYRENNLFLIMNLVISDSDSSYR